jgi:hypothetical protein
MFREATLGKTRVSVEKPLDPSDISQIDTEAEDAHQLRLPTTGCASAHNLVEGEIVDCSSSMR